MAPYAKLFDISEDRWLTFVVLFIFALLGVLMFLMIHSCQSKVRTIVDQSANYSSLRSEICAKLFEKENLCDQVIVEKDAWNSRRIIYGCGIRQECICDDEKSFCLLVAPVDKLEKK